MIESLHWQATGSVKPFLSDSAPSIPRALLAGTLRRYFLKTLSLALVTMEERAQNTLLAKKRFLARSIKSYIIFISIDIFSSLSLSRWASFVGDQPLLYPPSSMTLVSSSSLAACFCSIAGLTGGGLFVALAMGILD